MKRIILVVTIVALVGSAAIATAGEKSFADDAGDFGTAPDLTKVVVSETNGLLVFRIDGALECTDSSTRDLHRRRSSTPVDGSSRATNCGSSVFQREGREVSTADGRSLERLEVRSTVEVRPSRTADIHRVRKDDWLQGQRRRPDRHVRLLRCGSFKMVGDAVEERVTAVHRQRSVPWSFTLTRGESATAATRACAERRLVLPVRTPRGVQGTLRLPVRRADTGAPFTATAATCSATSIDHRSPPPRRERQRGRYGLADVPD